MKKMVSFLFLIMVSTSFLTGCFSYKDVNRTLFVTAIGVDIDGFGEYVFYLEAFTSSRAIVRQEIGEEKKVIFKAKGKSIFEAARNLNLKTNYTFNYSQNRAVIFTKKAATLGVDKIIAVIHRGQDLLLREYIYVCEDSPEKLLNIKLEEEQFMGIFLSELALNQEKVSKGTRLRIDEFFNNRLMGSKVNLVNLIKIDTNQPKERISITGLAVIQEDKMVDTLNTEETMAYHFLTDTFKKGNIVIANPQQEDNVATLDILGSGTKTKLKYIDNKIELEKMVTVKTNFAHSEGTIDLTSSEERSKLTDYGEEYIKRICKKLFSDYKEKNIDIFNIQRAFEMRYPREKVNNCIQKTQLNLNVSVDIKGSGTSTSFN